MPSLLNRRNFLQLAAASAAATALHAETNTSIFSFGKKPVATMPLDFTGLSYESPQLANPSFFSPENRALVALFREVGPTGGVLRTGGNLSAFTGWRNDSSIPITPTEQAALNKGKHYWEWDLTDPTIRHGNHEAVFTPASIETLAGFLNATGWKLLYGLNFATGTPQQATAEAACVYRLCGKNLLGFQLGNEVEFWGGGFRPKPWDFDHYFAQWREWVRIIREKIPSAPFAGPDTAINLDWVMQLAENEKNNIVLTTKHHYAMGPAGDPGMDATRLLGPDPDVAKEIAIAQRVKAMAGIGFRTAECGSCWHGGQPGVSNAYASAIWGADYMLTLAQGGHAGLNFHGGGEGFYSPITGDSVNGFTRQPLFFGMKFAQMFAGASILDSSLSTESNVKAYAARQHNDLLIALINKCPTLAEIVISRSSLGKALVSEAWQLSAPAINSLSGISFDRLPALPKSLPSKHGDTYQIAPYTAVLLRYTEASA